MHTKEIPDPDFDHRRRFGGVIRLYGEAAFARFERARVCVVGVGGVGSWAAEALARSGVGHLTLIDLDHIALSNTNRQLHALDGAFGMAKVEAMRQRIVAINPRAGVTLIDDFLTEDNLATLITPELDGVIDAIDQLRVKVSLAAHCRRLRLPLYVSGGAGGRIDPTRVRCDDLARSSGDPMLAKLRAELRRRHGFPREAGKRFGIEGVFSDEPLKRPASSDACDTAASGGLHCGGFGSAVSVTAVFGFQLAARMLARLAADVQA